MTDLLEVQTETTLIETQESIQLVETPEESTLIEAQEVTVIVAEAAQGPPGPSGLTDISSDPLAYYILAKA